MIFKEWLRFIYGMAMGTSVPYIKPTNRFMWPTALKKVDEQFNIFLGGSCICGILHDGKQTAIINTNSGVAAQQLIRYIESEIHQSLPIIFNTSASHDFFGGNHLFSNATHFYVPNVSEKILSEEWSQKPIHVEKIAQEKTFEIAGETIVVVPVSDSATKSDLVIFLKNRKTLFLGTLFYNHIHPFLHPLDGMNVANWISNLEMLMSRFQPEVVVPAEGDLGDAKAVAEFLSYLKSLSDPKIEFSDCRKNFDWMEIPGQTSLEENFDLLRENKKSFTKF